MRITEPPATRPAFPRCTVRGHDHPLDYLFTIVQDGTGTPARILQCPGGAYRFFHLAAVWAATATMFRYTRPRWGWPAEQLDDGTTATSTP
jgi:hypothetical protein